MRSTSETKLILSACLVALFLVGFAKAVPAVHKAIVTQVFNIHYTACLLNRRSEEEQRIPDFVNDPVILKDLDGNEYYVAIYSDSNARMADRPYNEFCHAFLINNKQYPAIKKEARFLQASRCHGIDIPGYDGDLPIEIEVLNTGESIGLSVVSRLNHSTFYSQTPTTNFLPFDTSVTIKNELLEGYHTHNANRDASFWSEEEGKFSKYYGYLMRVYVHRPSTWEAHPVTVSLVGDFMKNFDANYNPSDLQSCISFEKLNPPVNDGSPPETAIYGASVAGYYDRDASPAEFFANLDEQAFRKALELDGIHPEGDTNMETAFYELFDGIVNPPAAGFELDFMSPFRTVTGVLDFLYVGLVYLQRKSNGQYPSKRFDDSPFTMFLHIVAGFVLLYLGCFLRSRP